MEYGLILMLAWVNLNGGKRLRSTGTESSVRWTFVKGTFFKGSVDTSQERGQSPQSPDEHYECAEADISHKGVHAGLRFAVLPQIAIGRHRRSHFQFSIKVAVLRANRCVWGAGSDNIDDLLHVRPSKAQDRSTVDIHGRIRKVKVHIAFLRTLSYGIDMVRPHLDTRL